MRLEAEFRGNANEPHFLTFRDGMQGMELALRTPLTDAARDALVSSWRRLLLSVRTLRGVCATRAAGSATTPWIVGCHVAPVSEEVVFGSVTFPASVTSLSYLEIQFL
jgi:hypothetical protein